MISMIERFAKQFAKVRGKIRGKYAKKFGKLISRARRLADGVACSRPMGANDATELRDDIDNACHRQASDTEEALENYIREHKPELIELLEAIRSYL